MAEGIAASGVSCRLGGKDILKDVALSVRRGELVALVGPNGAGKTTLLRCLAGLVDHSGRVSVDGRPIGELSRSDRARSVAYLPQGHVFHWPLSVDDIVAIGRLPHMAGGGLSKDDRRAVDAALSAAGVSAFRDRVVTTLSGGERARVALARVLATEAGVLLADEPTASLDLHYQFAVTGMLRRKAHEGCAVLTVLHDLALAARFADRIAVLDRGQLVGSGSPADMLTPAMLADVFGVVADVIDMDGVPVAIPRGIRSDNSRQSV